METRKKTQTPRMDRKALILTVVGALLVIAIIVIAVVLMQRSGGDAYADNYEAAMEHYIAGEYSEAISSAQLAYAEDATEEAVLIIARSYAALNDYANAVSALENWVNAHGSGSEAGTLLEEYRTHIDDSGEDTVTIAGQEYAPDTQTLAISGQALTSSDLEAVASLTELTSLSLNDCSLSDISALSALTKLTTLSLNDNAITDLSPLSALTGLTALYLSGNAEISSLEPLYGLDGLTTLDIRGLEITDEQFEQLEAELPDCELLTDEPVSTATEITLGGMTFMSDVTELDLSNRQISDISALAECTDLESLNLSGNVISNISALASLPNLKTLDISNNEISNISPLMSLTQLESVNAANNAITNIAALAGHTALRELNLSDNPLASVDAISGMTNLTTLNLSSSGLDDGDMSALHTLTGLTSLNLEGNTSISAEAADALTAALPNCAISLPQEIYSVTLGGSSYAADSTYVDATSQGVTSLDGVEHFTGLQVLILDRNPGIDLSNAGALTTVTSLGLANCGLTDISALSTLTQLTSLDLMLNDLRDISALRYLTSLTELHLSMNEDLSDISALASLEELTTLSLNGTAVTDLSALENLTNLTVLDLEGCNIRDITPLLGLKNLRTLYAAGCGLSQQEIDELGDALPNCTIYT